MSSIEEYTQKEFVQAFTLLLEDLLINPKLKVEDMPKAVLLGGQSGAGKTNLHDIYRVKYKENVVVINGDEYRSRHPRYKEIDAKYGIDMPLRTAKWASQMVEALINTLSEDGYNLIVEGTLRTSTAPTKTASLLIERGYKVSLAVMAVKPEISLASCQLRYEQMRIAGTVPRAVDPEHHRTIVDGIVANMEVLEAANIFDGIRLYGRNKTCLFDSNDSRELASEALKTILFGAWSAEEQLHYDYLLKQLEKAKATN